MRKVAGVASLPSSNNRGAAEPVGSQERVFGELFRRLSRNIPSQLLFAAQEAMKLPAAFPDGEPVFTRFHVEEQPVTGASQIHVGYRGQYRYGEFDPGDEDFQSVLQIKAELLVNAHSLMGVDTHGEACRILASSRSHPIGLYLRGFSLSGSAGRGRAGIAPSLSFTDQLIQERILRALGRNRLLGVRNLAELNSPEGIPMLILDDSDWLEIVERVAQCATFMLVAIPVGEIGEGLEAELGMLTRLGAEDRTILLLVNGTGDTSAASDDELRPFPYRLSCDEDRLDEAALAKLVERIEGCHEGGVEAWRGPFPERMSVPAEFLTVFDDVCDGLQEEAARYPLQRSPVQLAADLFDVALLAQAFAEPRRSGSLLHALGQIFAFTFEDVQAGLELLDRSSGILDQAAVHGEDVARTYRDHAVVLLQTGDTAGARRRLNMAIAELDDVPSPLTRFIVWRSMFDLDVLEHSARHSPQPVQCGDLESFRRASDCYAEWRRSGGAPVDGGAVVAEVIDNLAGTLSMGGSGRALRHSIKRVWRSVFGRAREPEAALRRLFDHLDGKTPEEQLLATIATTPETRYETQRLLRTIRRHAAG